MKKPTIKFKEVWIVEHWTKELRTGFGHKFDSIQNGLFHDDNMWVVYPENGERPELIKDKEIFINEEDALNQLEIEKQDYIRFCEEQITEYEEKIKTITESNNERKKTK